MKRLPKGKAEDHLVEPTEMVSPEFLLYQMEDQQAYGQCQQQFGRPEKQAGGGE